jgi:putative ABC transport system permease protein
VGGVVWRRTVSADYFAALGIRILRGRGFGAEDHAPGHNVMVLSRTLAERLFPNEDPVGRVIATPLRGWPQYTVIGIASDAANGDVPGHSEPEYYLLRPRTVAPVAPLAPGAAPRGNDALLGGDASLIARALHAYDGEAFLIVRSGARADAVAHWIRSEAATLDATVPVTIATMRQRVGELSARPRFNAFLLAIFAGIGVLLAAFGLYGLIGFLVAQRTAEIGLRMAVGATPQKIAALVLSDGLRSIAAGVALGIAGAAVTARWLSGILFGMRAENPAVFGVAAAVLASAAVAAMLGPTLRAARIDPVEALRRE